MGTQSDVRLAKRKEQMGRLALLASTPTRELAAHHKPLTNAGRAVCARWRRRLRSAAPLRQDQQAAQTRHRVRRAGLWPSVPQWLDTTGVSAIGSRRQQEVNE